MFGNKTSDSICFPKDVVINQRKFMFFFKWLLVAVWVTRMDLDILVELYWEGCATNWAILSSLHSFRLTTMEP